MSKTVAIASVSQFDGLLKSSKIVVVDFYADWCGPCKTLAPVYEQLSAALTRENRLTFTKVNTDNQKEIAQRYNIRTIPTFIVFKEGKEVERTGTDPRKLQEIVKKVAAEAEGSAGGFGGSSSDSNDWRGGVKGYSDVSDQVEVKGLELLNADSDFGTVRALFDATKPTGLQKGKAAADAKDWVETDTDEQLMMYMPFQSTLKIHTLQITSLPPPSEDDDEVPMRPKTINLYTNRPHILGFEEAEDIPVTQTITLEEKDWDSASGTATIPLRFVKFQNVTSLVVFIVDGAGEGEKVRVDRFRVIGETGEKREGKIEKIEHDH